MEGGKWAGVAIATAGWMVVILRPFLTELVDIEVVVESRVNVIRDMNTRNLI